MNYNRVVKTMKMENELNILIEDDNAPIYVTQEEYEIFKNAIVVEDVRTTYASRKWSKLIKEICDSTCQCCGSKDNLESHHILSFKYYPALRIDLKNGVCLCKKCHKKYHSLYNLKNCSPLSLFNFINEYKRK